jgi:N-acetylmuramoyl-L-alanine amidase
MPVNSIVISSGHGLYVRGASGVIDEVDEARKVVDRLADELNGRGIMTTTYHDNVSRTQSENLERIVSFHNSKVRDLDISVHFNASSGETDDPIGTEVWHLCHEPLAAAMSEAIAFGGGLKNRGAKQTGDFYFLNHTAAPAVLLEICFVNSAADCECYQVNFEAIVQALANLTSSEEVDTTPDPEPLFYARGKASYFGGPNDLGVDEDEGLAFIYEIDDAPHLFLPQQPTDATGLARRLNPFVNYVACRWDYQTTSKASLLQARAKVKATKTGIELFAFPADWGPHEDTGRVADLSPGLMESLGIDTDDEVEVVFPAEE